MGSFRAFKGVLRGVYKASTITHMDKHIKHRHKHKVYTNKQAHE